MHNNNPHPTRRRFTQGACALGLLPWLASCGGGSGAGVVDDQTAGPTGSGYGRAIGDMLASYRLPGVLAGVRIAGRPAWMQAFGKADLATGTPLALNSSFPIRSITKSFTVTLVLQLVRDGVLSLDDKIGRYFANVPNGKLISLADMAGNQSGLVNYSSLKPFIDLFVADLQRVWTEQELVQFSFAVPPDFQPGAQYDYSNTNTVLLGMLVEQVTGQTLADAMGTRIFKPLALGGTRYPSSAALPAPAPTPYAVDVNTGASDDQPLISPTSLAGSGAITSTLPDLLDWGDELGRGSLVGSALNDLRRSSSRPATNGPEYDRYGLGIGQIGNWWGHTGSGVGFQVATMHLAARGATVAVMVNATPDGSPRRDLNFAQELFQRLAAVVEAG